MNGGRAFRLAFLALKIGVAALRGCMQGPRSMMHTRTFFEAFFRGAMALTRYTLLFVRLVRRVAILNAQDRFGTGSIARTEGVFNYLGTRICNIT